MVFNWLTRRLKRDDVPSLSLLLGYVRGTSSSGGPDGDVTAMMFEAGEEDGRLLTPTRVVRTTIKNAVEVAMRDLAVEYREKRGELGKASIALKVEADRLKNVRDPRTGSTSSGASASAVHSSDSGADDPMAKELEERRRRAAEAKVAAEKDQKQGEYETAQGAISSVQGDLGTTDYEADNLLELYKAKAEACRERGEALLSFYADGYAVGQAKRGDDRGADEVNAPIEFQVPKEFA